MPKSSHNDYNQRRCVQYCCAVLTDSAVTMQLSAVMTQVDVDAACVGNLGCDKDGQHHA